MLNINRYVALPNVTARIVHWMKTPDKVGIFRMPAGIKSAVFALPLPPLAYWNEVLMTVRTYISGAAPGLKTEAPPRMGDVSREEPPR